MMSRFNKIGGIGGGGSRVNQFPPHFRETRPFERSAASAICSRRWIDVRSLSARMLLAALGTLLVSFIAFMTVFFVESAPKLDTLFRRFQALQLEDAVAALKREG